MALPAQVQKQADDVRQLMAELSGAQTAVAKPDSQTAASTGDVTTTSASTAPATVPVGNEPPAGDHETLEQKYRTLQGKYNAEVPRLHAENKSLANRLTSLEQLLASAPPPPAAPTTTPQKLITDKDIEDYGDSVDLMRRVSREEDFAVQAKIDELTSLVRQLQSNVVPRLDQVTTRQAQTDEQQFWSELAAAVPNWQATNNDADFQSWLLEVDPLTGITRQTYLDDAQRNLDVQRVIKFFTLWSGISGAPPARTAKPSAASELEAQVAPGRSRSTSAPNSTRGRTYTPLDIKAFFADVTAGKYRGREAERNTLEHDIFAAQREGRIVAA